MSDQLVASFCTYSVDEAIFLAHAFEYREQVRAYLRALRDPAKHSDDPLAVDRYQEALEYLAEWWTQ